MFQLFDKNHILYLIGYTLLTVIFYYFISYSKNKEKLLKGLAIGVLTVKIVEIMIRYNLGESWKTLLPLHLCNLTLILVIIGSLLNNKCILKVTFFWSAGAVFALITPEVRVLFPSFLNISFFVTHVYVVLISVIQYRLFNLKPTFKSWYIALFYINIASIIIFFINKRLGTNYLFVNRKPAFTSPLDYFGDWPNYIIVVMLLYIAITFVMYILLKERKKRG